MTAGLVTAKVSRLSVELGSFCGVHKLHVPYLLAPGPWAVPFSASIILACLALGHL